MVSKAIQRTFARLMTTLLSLALFVCADAQEIRFQPYRVRLEGILTPQLSPNGISVLYATDNHILRVMDVKTLGSRVLVNPGTQVASMGWMPDSRHVGVYIQGEDKHGKGGGFEIWDVTAGRRVFRRDYDGNADHKVVAFTSTPDFRKVYLALAEGRIETFATPMTASAITDAPESAFSIGRDIRVYQCNQMRLSPDGAKMSIVGGKEILVVDMAQGALIAKWKCINPEGFFSGNGGFYVARDFSGFMTVDMSVVILDMGSGKETRFKEYADGWATPGKGPTEITITQKDSIVTLDLASMKELAKRTFQDPKASSDDITRYHWRAAGDQFGFGTWTRFMGFQLLPGSNLYLIHRYQVERTGGKPADWLKPANGEFYLLDVGSSTLINTQAKLREAGFDHLLNLYARTGDAQCRDAILESAFDKDRLLQIQNLPSRRKASLKSRVESAPDVEQDPSAQVFLFALTSEEEHLITAKQAATTPARKAFVDALLEPIERRRFEEGVEQRDIASLEEYIASDPDNRFLPDARKILNGLRGDAEWTTKVSQTKDVRVVKAFADRYSESAFYPQALDRISKLEFDAIRSKGFGAVLEFARQHYKQPSAKPALDEVDSYARQSIRVLDSQVRVTYGDRGWVQDWAEDNRNIVVGGKQFNVMVAGSFINDAKIPVHVKLECLLHLVKRTSVQVFILSTNKAENIELSDTFSCLAKPGEVYSFAMLFKGISEGMRIGNGLFNAGSTFDFAPTPYTLVPHWNFDPATQQGTTRQREVMEAARTGNIRTTASAKDSIQKWVDNLVGNKSELAVLKLYFKSKLEKPNATILNSNGLKVDERECQSGVGAWRSDFFVAPNQSYAVLVGGRRVAIPVKLRLTHVILDDDSALPPTVRYED